MNYEFPKIIDLVFNGYINNETLDNFPEKSGVYCVFAVSKDLQRVGIKFRLIYIGETNNLYETHHSHDRYDDFINEAKNGETIWYNYALVDEDILEDIEHAMICHYKPVLNNQNVLNYDGDSLEITCHGKIGNLDSYFEISKTNEKN